METTANDIGSSWVVHKFFSTDSWGRMLAMVYPDGDTVRYAYDRGWSLRRVTSRKGSVREMRQHEIDFVVNRGYERIYIQSAWMIPDREKMEQETFSLKHTGDNFKKIVIDGQPSAKYRDEDGICHIGLAEFLLDPRSIETL